MNGNEFLKMIRRFGRKNGVPVTFETRPGKGSHGRLFYGEQFTALKDRKEEIGSGLFRKMLRDLKISPNDIKK